MECNTCALGEFEASSLHFCEALQTSVEVGSVWVAPDALVGLASHLTTSDEGEEAANQAVEVLAFFLGHPSSSKEARHRAMFLLAELEDRLSPAVAVAAKERGRARELEAIAGAYLSALETRLDTIWRWNWLLQR